MKQLQPKHSYEVFCATEQAEEERQKEALAAFLRRERRPIQLTGAGMVKFFLLLCGCHGRLTFTCFLG